MNRKTKIIIIGYILFLSFLPLSRISAQWPDDPSVNRLICGEPYGQMNPHMTRDGGRGVIVTWWDNRNGTTNSDIYVQKVDSQGNTIWNEGGLWICGAEGQQTHPRVVSDGSGGAIIIWRDYRDGANSVTMYGQRINGVGQGLWNYEPNGVQLSSATNHKRWPYICSDGSGGAIITWEEQATAGALYDVRAQRVNSSGLVEWGANGVLVYDDQSEQYNQEYPHITADGSGGCIITWQDEREGGGIPLIYAQRINSSGALQWGLGSGVKLCTDESSGQYRPYIIGDESANSIIAWYDYRSGADYDIYAQKIDSSGLRQWTNSADLVCSAAGHQGHPQLVTDGAGGAIITWYDDLYGTTSDIYAQKVDSSGINQWPANGVEICTAVSDQETNDYKYETIVTDGAGGAVISWWDKRAGTTPDIYAQRINSSGQLQWTANGVAVCTASYGQWTPTMLTDREAGAFIVWMDYRNNPSVYDIYMQRIFSDGALPVELSLFTPQTTANSIILRWSAPFSWGDVQYSCRFEIERSLINQNNWESVGFVEGNANSNTGDKYSFEDKNPLSGVVKYRIKKIYQNGTYIVSNTVEAEIKLASERVILQNYPNPFNPTTFIEFQIPSEGFVELKIYDVLGNNVQTLVSGIMDPGIYNIRLDAPDLASGIYFCRLKCDKHSTTRKIIIMK